MQTDRHRLSRILTGALLALTPVPATAQVVCQLVKDIQKGLPSSNPQSFCVAGDILFFTATHPVTGSELYRSDGTANGTVLVKDIRPGTVGSNCLHLTQAGNRIFFSAHDHRGPELWTSDGTAAGTRLVKDISPGARGSRPLFLTALGDRVVFAAEVNFERNPWISDGTTAGTRMLKDINRGRGNPNNFVAFGSRVLFAAEDRTAGRELWVTDGTQAGTRILKELAPGRAGGQPAALTRVGNRVFFTAVTAQAGRELWVTDGSPDGTRMVKDVRPGNASSDPLALTAMQDVLLFDANDGTHGREIWRSDGTAAGTVLVQDSNRGAGSRTLRGGVASGDAVFFQSFDVFGNELWMTDGKTVRRVKDIRAGRNSSSPASFVAIEPNRLVLFAANDGGFGIELWRSDGTVNNTANICDIRIIGSSQPTKMTRVGTNVFFTANDGKTGRELWRIRLTSLSAGAAEPFGQSCSGSSGRPPLIGATRAPHIKTTDFRMTCRDAKPRAPAVGFLGAQRAFLSVGFGCQLHTLPFLTVPLTTSSAGGTRLTVPFPNTQSLIGSQLFGQFVVFDAGARYAGVAALSKGLGMVIGK